MALLSPWPSSSSRLVGISNRIIVLHHGRKIAEGTSEAIAYDEIVITAFLCRQFGQ